MELTSTQQQALEQFDQLARSEGSANKAALKIGISSVPILKPKMYNIAILNSFSRF